MLNLYLSAIGIVCIIMYTSAFKGTREFLSNKGAERGWSILYHMITCGICMGFWSGVAVFSYKQYAIDAIILNALACSFLSGLSVHLINYLKRK